MQEFILLFGKETLGNTVLLIVAIGFILREGKKLNSTLKLFYEREKNEEELYLRVAKHDEDIACIEGQMQELIYQVEANSEESREYRRTSLSDKIFRKYREYTSKGEVTKDELDNFRVCVDRYVKTIKPEEERNDLVLTKYYPDVKRLPVVEGRTHAMFIGDEDEK